VQDVAATLTGLPLEGEKGILKIGVVGAGPDRFRVGAWRVISPEFFTVWKTPLVRGRLFTNQDTASSEPVVIINQALARRLWPNGANPLDDRLRLGEGAGPEFDDPPRRIVGIVGDVHQEGLGDAPLHAAYVPIAQLPAGEMALFNRSGLALTWVVRTATAPAVVSHAIQEALRTASGAPVARVRSMEEVATSSTARPRFELWVMTMFGAMAVVLAGLGVYGVAAYAVQQRTREIGIRMALGATAGAIGRMVLARGVGLALAGVAVGIGAAFGLAQLLSRFLFGVTPHDATVFAIVPGVVAIVALAAVWLPARRATRVEPIIALRAD
jgi:putative ABC transport system permease protein